MPLLYFGHPINTYNSTLEERLFRQISLSFRGWNVENPNQEYHQKKYEQWKKKTGSGMDYFIKRVLPNCKGGIFLPFRDGTWSSGVFMEAKFFADRGFRIWKIDQDGNIGIFNLSGCSPLSREKTVCRVRTASGETIPY